MVSLCPEVLRLCTTISKYHVSDGSSLDICYDRFNIIMSFIIAVLALLSGAIPLAVVCFIGFGISAYYAYVVWGRIPFAASNLVTALTSVRSNFGLSFFAYSSLVVRSADNTLTCVLLWCKSLDVSISFRLSNVQHILYRFSLVGAFGGPLLQFQPPMLPTVAMPMVNASTLAMGLSFLPF